MADRALAVVGVEAVSHSRGAEDAVGAFAVGGDEGGESNSDDGGETHVDGVGGLVVGGWLFRRKVEALDGKS